MNEPHIHAKVIKAWADGQIVEFKSIGGVWVPVEAWPAWFPAVEYRIKPEPAKEKRFYYQAANTYGRSYQLHDDDLVLVFDGDTGALIATQLL